MNMLRSSGSIPGWCPWAKALVAALLFASAAQSARANNALRAEVAEAAKQIKSRLEGRNVTSVTVSDVRGPAAWPATGGPGVVELLIEELAKIGLSDKPQSSVGITGMFRLVQDQATSVPSAEIEFRLVNPSDDPIGEPIKRNITDTSTIISLFGPSVSFPPDMPDSERLAALAKSIERPNVRVSGTRVSNPRSKFAVEVIVEGTPAHVENKDGLAFVEIRRNQTYSVMVHNGSDREVAVSLAIDGLSMFTFSELKDKKTGGPRYAHLMFPANSSFEIKGWHVNDTVSDSFKVVEYSKSAVASLQREKSRIGTITVTFSECSQPDDQFASDLRSDVSEDFDATGRGERIEQKFEPVDRKVGAIIDTVSIRYTKRVK